jgi:hypothetical protein
MRFRTTVIYQTCARIKNVCQTCLPDLESGLPTQVRDTTLAPQNEALKSNVDREHYAQNMEGKVRTTPQFDGSAIDHALCALQLEDATVFAIIGKSFPLPLSPYPTRMSDPVSPRTFVRVAAIALANYNLVF